MIIILITEIECLDQLTVFRSAAVIIEMLPSAGRPSIRIRIGTVSYTHLGKKLVLSFTTGAPEALYSHKGAMGYTIDEFLACYKATCRLTHMEYSGSVYTCGVSYGNRTTPELIEQQRNISVAHTERLIELLETL